MKSESTVLVLGATGGIGGEVARQLRDEGWAVKAMQRDVVDPRATGVVADGVTWILGDAMNAAHVARAARDCSVIVHAVNPPGYRKWPQLVLPMLENTIAAARNEQALVLLPGTIYNYGRDAFPLLTEQSPQHPFTRKGAIRVEMEKRLQTHAEQGGRVLIVRAGDFFGPSAGNNWFGQGLVQPGRRIRTIRNPGERGVGHSWSYLPDVAATMVRLLQRRDSLDPFATFHMEGQYDHDGAQMIRAIYRVVVQYGHRGPKIAAFPWWLVSLLSPLLPTFHEVLEMRYLWQQPIRLDNAKLIATLGQEPRTPLEEAVEATLIGLYCVRGPAVVRS